MGALSWPLFRPWTRTSAAPCGIMAARSRSRQVDKEVVMRFFGNIQKIDAEQRMVFGYASTEAVDAHGEIVLKSAIEDALADYLEFANLREMHQLSAVGTTEEASVDDRGLYIG